ncbi:MAG: hypothetical protein JRI25_04635 [Deltaproteobacteria bacterium]|nr:hypothetical protein [Deltaproteobacteria bacterium]MBW2253866.1 hypothetical protein [Deltaproteobacteria bacterium]
MHFPKYASSDQAGGCIAYRFDAAAWTTAFQGNEEGILIQDGAVYKGFVADSQLIVSGDGTVGPAGVYGPGGYRVGRRRT